MDTDCIKDTVYHLGADICGIASVDRFTDAPRGFHPHDILPDTQSVIVFGKQFTKSVFEANSNAPYTLVRDILIERIDDISVRLSVKIEEEGYTAVPIPSSEPYEYWNEQERHGRGILSLKHSAHLAGLGFIGKNTLLLNRTYGNRLWLGAVISNLELIPDDVTETSCPENCRICLESCPQTALDGVSINQKRCREISATSTEGGGWLLACNVCRKECPYSRI